MMCGFNGKSSQKSKRYYNALISMNFVIRVLNVSAKNAQWFRFIDKFPLKINLLLHRTKQRD
jgi:hypothetical protein